jgi:hypothetical protein
MAVVDGGARVGDWRRLLWVPTSRPISPARHPARRVDSPTSPQRAVDSQAHLRRGRGLRTVLATRRRQLITSSSSRRIDRPHGHALGTGKFGLYQDQVRVQPCIERGQCYEGRPRRTPFRADGVTEAGNRPRRARGRRTVGTAGRPLPRVRHAPPPAAHTATVAVGSCGGPQLVRDRLSHRPGGRRCGRRSPPRRAHGTRRARAPA